MPLYLKGSGCTSIHAVMETAMLPTDLLLEIAMRFDPTTVLRYVATCRHLQHRTADLAFLRRTCQHDGYGFIPTLLPGVLIYRKATNRSRPSKPYHQRPLPCLTPSRRLWSTTLTYSSPTRLWRRMTASLSSVGTGAQATQRSS